MRPNVVYVIPHDLGQHLGCYAGSIRTPNIDRVAGEGARFDHFFCTSPQCSPARGSLVTGRYPHSNGLMGLVNRGWSLPQTETTLAQRFSDAGYTTALFGFQHERRQRDRLGYRVLGRKHRRANAEVVGPEAVAFIREQAKSPAPFYISVGTRETHRPFGEGQYTPEAPENVHVPGFLPATPEVRSDLCKLQGALRATDQMVGDILHALEETEAAGNTILIFTTDHGLPFPPYAKCSLYDGGIRIAFAARWPGVVAPGQTRSELLSGVDFAPTLLEAANLPVPGDIQGRSFLPLLRGESCEPATRIFAEQNWHGAAYLPMRCVRTRDFKYIRNWERKSFVRDVLHEPAGLNDTPRDTPFCAETSWTDDGRPFPREELYDLRQDPTERVNLAGRTDYEGTRDELSAILTRWMEETGDPLLDGPIPMRLEQFLMLNTMLRMAHTMFAAGGPETSR